MGKRGCPARAKADRAGHTACVIANPGLRFARSVSLGDRSMLTLAALLPGSGFPLILLTYLATAPVDAPPARARFTMSNNNGSQRNAPLLVLGLRTHLHALRLQLDRINQLAKESPANRGIYRELQDSLPLPSLHRHATATYVALQHGAIA